MTNYVHTVFDQDLNPLLMHHTGQSITYTINVLLSNFTVALLSHYYLETWESGLGKKWGVWCGSEYYLWLCDGRPGFGAAVGEDADPVLISLSTTICEKSACPECN